MSFLPVLKQYTFTPGFPFSYSFIYYQGVPTTAAVVDLTGASAQLVIASSTATILTINSGATMPATGIYFGGQENTPTNGIVEIYIDAADASAIPTPYTQYTLSLTTNAFGLQQVLYGSFASVGSLP